MGIRRLVSFIPAQQGQYEEWAPVRGFEERYIISNMGRLFDIYYGLFCISIHNPGEKYLFYPQIDEYVDIAMMKAFNYIPGCENMYVDHKDGYTLYNYLPNLEWTNEYQQIIYEGNSGSNSYLSKNTEKDIEEVCKLLAQDKYTSAEISEMTGVSKDVINSVKYGNSWKNISSKYNFVVDANAHRTIKYSDEIVHKICQMLQSDPNITISEIAKQLNLGNTYVREIAYRITRTDISDNYTWASIEERNTNNRNAKAKEEAKKILKNNAEGYSTEEIAEITGLTKNIIYNLRSELKKAGEYYS